MLPPNQSVREWQRAAWHDDEARTLTVVRSSHLVRIAERALSLVIAAWRDSATGRLARRVIVRLNEQTVLERARQAGAVIAVASATALVVIRLSPRPEPLIWIVPAASLIGSLCLIVAARSRPSR
jgi:hypothetical protein